VADRALTSVSASTVRREEALLKHLLTTAVPKYLERNPLAGLKRLRVADTDTRVLTHQEEARLLKALRIPRPTRSSSERSTRCCACRTSRR
jgi:hypothetical protein